MCLPVHIGHAEGNDLNKFRVAPIMVRDQAAESIKEAILSGFLQPGQRLVERNLCNMVRVSQTSIREALQVLEGEKLIVDSPIAAPALRPRRRRKLSKSMRYVPIWKGCLAAGLP